MKTFTETVDWALLRQQKEALLTIPEQLINATQYDALQGIISLIDHLQDYAVWSEDDELMYRFQRRYGYNHPPYFLLGLIIVGIIIVMIEMFKTVQHYL